MDSSNREAPFFQYSCPFVPFGLLFVLILLSEKPEEKSLFYVFKDSVAGMTCYGLEGKGLESRGGRDFPHLSRPALGPTMEYRVIQRDKAAGTWF